MMGEFLFEHTVAWGWIILAGIFAVATAVYTAWRYLPRSWTVLALLLLRILFISLFVWCLFLPAMKRTLTESFKPRFLVVVDTSASMTLTPAPDRSNRWSVTQSVLRQPWVKALAAQCDIDFYSFAVDLGSKLSAAEALALAPTGDSTSLRNSLRKCMNRYKGQDLRGALLLSDGLDTREANDAWASGDWPCPIYTVRPEEPDIWKVEPETRVDSVETPLRGVVGWDTELKASVSGQGTGGQPIDVQLYEDKRLLRTAPVTLPDDGGSRELTFRLSHPETGNFIYTVVIPPLKGESRTNNNSFSISVQIIDTKNRLLYLEGTPRYESKFLTRALQSTKEITPVCFIRGPAGRFLSYGTKSTSSPDINSAILAKFKIVILGDLDAGELGADRAQALLRFVETGGSLVLLGGAKAWGENGFAATPLKTILPVQQTGKLNLQEGRLELKLTSEGRAHPAFLADDQKTPWTGIPALLSIFQGGTLTPGAMTLIATDPDARPVIIAQQYGQGKVVAILTDSLWRWQLTPGKQNQYQEFWARLLLWLSPTEGDLKEYQLDLFANAERLILGDTIDLRARLGGTEEINLKDVAVTCSIQGPDNRRMPFSMASQQVTTTAGKRYPGFGVSFTPTLPGLHTAVAKAQIGAKTIESPIFSFFIKPFTPETNPQPANVSILKTLAAASHGQFCEPDTISDVLAALQMQKTEVERIEMISLWNSWLVIACLMTLLVIEWIVRKLKNMA
jgi:hypothetical protein